MESSKSSMKSFITLYGFRVKEMEKLNNHLYCLTSNEESSN